MVITIVPQTPEQFERLMKFLEKHHATYAEDLAAKRAAVEAHNQALMSAVQQVIAYVETMNGPKH